MFNNRNDPHCNKYSAYDLFNYLITRFVYLFLVGKIYEKNQNALSTIGPKDKLVVVYCRVLKYFNRKTQDFVAYF